MTRTVRPETFDLEAPFGELVERDLGAFACTPPGLRVLADLASVRAPAWDLAARRDLAALLEPALVHLRPHVAALDALRSLAHPQAGVVLATAAPGFLCGPLANLFAALHAVRLARSLARLHEKPFVPVLWNDADDVELGRVHPAWILGEHEDPRRIALAGLSARATPHALRRFDAERDRLGAARAYLEQRFAREPFLERALEACFPKDGESFARAFTRGLLDLCGGLGLVVLEPDALRVELSRALADLFAPLGAEAHREPPGPELGPGAVLALRLEEHSPSAGTSARALRWRDGALRFDGEPGSRTARELAACLVREPELWLPGPALLPAVQERALPVALRVTGAAEFAGLAQLAGRAPGAVRGELAPCARRVSLTLVEPEIARTLERAGLSAADVVRTPPAPEIPLARRAAAARDESPTAAALGELMRSVQDRLRALEGELAGDELQLAHGLRRAARRLKNELGDLRERARRLRANRSGKDRRHASRVARNLLPTGRLQQDVLAPFGFLARYGPAGVEALFDCIPAAAPAHRFVRAAELPRSSAQDTGRAEPRPPASS